MGRVYKAEDHLLKRTVAFKILTTSSIVDAKDIRRFVFEARNAANLKHPGIITIYDVSKTETDYFISMEYIDGKSLLSLIDEEHPIPIADILRISGKLFNALYYSHQEGIIHRDIKPANIMVTSDKNIKLVDFGIAAQREELSNPTETVRCGTPVYMSPEQIDQNTIGHWTDIYSAGVTMFQLVTGIYPFKGSISEILAQHLYTPVPSITRLRPDTPEQLVKIIEKCMEKEEKNRFQNARAVQDALENVTIENGNSNDDDENRDAQIRCR
ncbi:MAG: serine/threonine protein kinase [bacterium]|nr:serine/threonine protein kinase [bacterium]